MTRTLYDIDIVQRTSQLLVQGKRREDRMTETGSGKRSRGKSGQGGEGEALLTRERIVATAIAILDNHGAAGLTMRALAQELGSGVMSLYWHVKSKEDVLDLALDTVLAYAMPTEEPDPAAWRIEVISMLGDWRRTMLDHPWSAALLPNRPLGPNTLVRLEYLHQRLLHAGVAADDINAAIWSIWNYVMGATTTRASFGPSLEDRAALHEAAAGPDERFPGIGAARLLLDDDWDGTFHKGLGFLLDGIAARR
jgi:AcrR family transcriptional regulator